MDYISIILVTRPQNNGVSLYYSVKAMNWISTHYWPILKVYNSESVLKMVSVHPYMQQKALGEIVIL